MLPMAGRVALVTGVSRRRGIAAAVALRLQAMGTTVVATGWPPHDAEMPWGEEGPPDGLAIERHDLADPAVPAALIDDVVARHGRLDAVVAVHARSSGDDLAHTSAAELDACWAANVRSIVLLAQRFAQVRAGFASAADPPGRMLWFTSGQHRGPMAGEIAYAVSKGALHQMTATLADALVDAGILANCINPGPVDTGWADGEVHAIVERRFPQGRWGTPDDVANLVAFLLGDDGSWIVGQVIDSEGGFRRG